MLWWVLAEGRIDGWWLGAVAVVTATCVSVILMPPAVHRLRWGQIPSFVLFFLRNSVRGGFQVAMMALRGRAALQPGVLELQLNLPAGGPRVLMTNVIGLMPGTLSVELAEDRLRVHVLDERLPIEAEAGELEARISALFGVGR
ncbi:MAG: Na+/H+ antiporter subunit E [Methylotenera sp.]|nr:Na+/H+ antiporter subunit E [Methylotenera sp.]